MTTYENISTAIANANGTDSAVKIAFNACKGLRLERGLLTTASDETGISFHTMKLYAIGGEIVAKLSANGYEYVKGDALKIRQLIGDSRRKSDDYRALTGKELDTILIEWDGSDLAGLITLVQALRYVEPTPPVELDESDESEDSGDESEDTPNSLVSVVLSHLPHLTPEELSLVADSVAQLMALKTLSKV